MTQMGGFLSFHWLAMTQMGGFLSFHWLAMTQLAGFLEQKHSKKEYRVKNK